MATDDLLAQIRANDALPRHVAIIMDGNGRWARDRFLPRQIGHRNGMKAVREVVEGATEAGLSVLSLFAFSQENWQRPPIEVSALMSLLEEYVASETEELKSNGVRVHVLGELDRLSPQASRAIERVIRETEHNERLRLNLFISYGARAEIVRAARLLAQDAVEGRIDPASIDEQVVADRMFTKGCPDPDLLIRTSGEQRISNFLLWQIAYAELHISPVLWPDFSRQDLFRASLDFQSRDRRFGRVSV
jgi:undecaprenyl diphosphate synthase